MLLRDQPRAIAPPCLKLLHANLALLLLLTGCVAPRWPGAEARPAACVALYSFLEDAAADTGTANAAFHSVPGFPYLRVDRFFGHFAARLEEPRARAAWIQRAADLDRQIRLLEWQNLPPGHALRRAWPDSAAFDARLQQCATLTADSDRHQPGFWNTLTQRVTVPDDYHSLYRFPLYPLASLPVAWLTERARDQFRSWFATPWEQLQPRGQLIRYHLPSAAPLSTAERGELLHHAAANPLGLPLPSPEAEARLAAALAPEFVVDTEAEYDRPGALHWQDESWSLDTTRPALYYYLGHTLVQGWPALQITYALWFSARDGEAAPMIERGPLDGLSIRVTLHADGRVAMVDGMNNCGCYHYFLPPADAVPRQAESGIAPGLFIGQDLPADYPARPLRLRILAGWHQLQQVSTAKVAGPAVDLRLLPYADLESLPNGAGGHTSLFRPDGVAKGSPRIEHVLLFPMGVADVGSMRQRGHHPITLVGREHFDDADLLDRHFTWTGH